MKLLSIPIGIILIIIGPVILWNAESQRRAADFESAKDVSASSDKSGYLRITGQPELEDTLLCPDSKNEDIEKKCLYISSSVEEYQLSDKEICSNTRPTDVIRTLDREECNSDNENCKPCYLVEEREWESIDSDSQYVDFTIGDYIVRNSSKANIVGADTYEEFIPNDVFGENEFDYLFEDIPEQEASASRQSNPEIGDRKISYSFVPAKGDLLVAGESTDGEISEDNKEFVISTLTYAQTLEKLEGQDSSAKWGLRALSLALVVFGAISIFTGIASIPGFFLDAIPFIGDKLEDKLNQIASLFGGCMGLLIWGFMFFVVMLLKNLVALIIGFGIVFAVIAGLTIFVMKRGKNTLVEKEHPNS